MESYKKSRNNEENNKRIKIKVYTLERSVLWYINLQQELKKLLK